MYNTKCTKRSRNSAERCHLPSPGTVFITAALVETTPEVIPLQGGTKSHLKWEN